MSTISELKEKSGAKFFVSIIGRSKIRKNTRAYKFIETSTMDTIKEGFGVIHGGAKGGAMRAVNDIANLVIAERGLVPEYNIAVPQDQFKHLPMVSGAVFTDFARDIYDRLRIILSGDIIIVSPLAGPGTELELTTVFHENTYCRDFYQPLAPKPMIFLQAPGGVDWRRFLMTKSEILDLQIKDLDSCDWLHFVNSKDEFHKLLIYLKTNLLASR